ncbi:TIGR01777 family oxidoreductase [Enhygromyxa salina]|uniref:Epimerase family protein n=1 Tax=Enhygromyxa salina TaxID=215803 RepID=A0A2S9YYM8_9BACT|nr:TIGR01777 family oxidoreductase [Enhygromyxa salina]PRQ10193.1 Epimerase family protein [Enhygromyxa salina]
MRVAITGATGLIGGALSAALRERGDEVVGVSRSPGPSMIGWDPRRGFDAADALSGFDAVVNLAGESIAGRWTATKKRKILESRTNATGSVVKAIASASERPRVLINASAVGIYGDRGAEPLDEHSQPGSADEFLVGVTQAWEAAAREVEQLPGPPVRLCLARFGVVLDANGGALGTMLGPFRLGLGGEIGRGDQWMAWVHVRDVAAALMYLLDHDDCIGAYNLAAPNPVDNAAFTAALGRVLGRPTFMRVPKLGVRVLFGEMGQALLLDSQRAVPKRLLAAGFEFEFSAIDSALRELLS